MLLVVDNICDAALNGALVGRKLFHALKTPLIQLPRWMLTI